MSDDSRHKTSGSARDFLIETRRNVNGNLRRTINWQAANSIQLDKARKFCKIYAMFINKNIDKFYDFQAKTILHIAQN